MGVSITSTGNKLRHPYRANTFEFISAGSLPLPHLRIWFFSGRASRFNDSTGGSAPRPIDP